MSILFIVFSFTAFAETLTAVTESSELSYSAPIFQVGTGMEFIDAVAGETNNMRNIPATSSLTFRAKIQIPLAPESFWGVYTDLSMQKINSSKFETSFLPSGVIGLATSSNCTICMSVGGGAERFQSFAIGNSSTAAIAVPVAKAVGSVGYKVFTGNYSIMPKMHGELLQGRNYMNDEEVYINHGPVFRACPSVEFAAQSGQFAGLALTMKSCLQRQEQYSPEKYSVSQNTFGTELSYAF